jgi:SAM-dependent methyltransferase
MDHDSDGPASRIPLMADPAVADRYAWLAGLVAPSAGERVVDLGCGESSVLELVLAYLGHGIAVGIDNDRSALRAARSSVPASGPRALFVQADLADPLPLADASMDVVFSHDVLEQLPDPDALLREVCRVLRPGGRLVLGHPDLDTAVLAGADVRLTRRLVQAYCDTQHPWMPRADGTIGRRLPEIVLRSPFDTQPGHGTGAAHPEPGGRRVRPVRGRPPRRDARDGRRRQFHRACQLACRSRGGGLSRRLPG